MYLVLVMLSMSAKPPQAPRPLQAPLVEEAIKQTHKKTPVCGKSSCDCGCQEGDMCRCAKAKSKRTKTCECSPACTCGCNEGAPCRCSQSVPSYRGLHEAPTVITTPTSRVIYYSQIPQPKVAYYRQRTTHQSYLQYTVPQQSYYPPPTTGFYGSGSLRGPSCSSGR